MFYYKGSIYIFLKGISEIQVRRIYYQKMKLTESLKHTTFTSSEKNDHLNLSN